MFRLLLLDKTVVKDASEYHVILLPVAVKSGIKLPKHAVSSCADGADGEL